MKNEFYNAQGALVNGWYVACQSKEIGKGKSKKSVIFDVPLVLWRDGDGTVQSLLDRCIHRNAPLSAGKVENDCVVCPYHGWTFDGNGTCTKIPSEGPHSERIPSQKVDRFQVIEKYELVWVWMGENEKSKAIAPFEMPIMSGKGWKHYYMLTDFDNNVTDLVENFMDVPHTVYVHESWFREKKQLRIEAEVERTEDSVLVSYDQSNDSIGFSGKLFNPKGLPMTHSDNFYMPNNTRVDYVFGEYERAFIICSTCTPISAFKSRVYTLISYNFGSINFLAKLFLPWYTKKVIMQDVWIMEKQGNNLKQFEGAKTYRSTQADTMHVYIETLRNWAMRGADPEKKPSPIKKRMEFWV